MIYHVNAVTGDDRSPGSEARPWRTLQRAARAMRPGDRVVVYRGHYCGATRITAADTEWEAVESDETILDGEWDGRDTRYAPAVLSIEAPRIVVAGFMVMNAPALGSSTGCCSSIVVVAMSWLSCWWPEKLRVRLVVGAVMTWSSCPRSQRGVGIRSLGVMWLFPCR